MAVELVLQTADEHGALGICRSYFDLPIDRSCRITVVSSSAQLREDLLACIQRALTKQGGSTGGCNGLPGGGAIAGCRAHHVSGVDQLVVVIVDNAHPTTPALEATVQSYLAQQGARALGVLPIREPQSSLPPVVLKFQATHFQSGVCEATEDVLSAAGAGQDDRRIFLSYSREDRVQALELAEALGDQHFAVYLDTRSNSPASIWHDVLADALVDAGIVVVLETPSSTKSSSVRRELGLAAARGAGIIAVQPHAVSTPFRTASARYLGSPGSAGSFIAEQHRLRLSAQRAARLRSVQTALQIEYGLSSTIDGATIRCGGFLIGVHERPVEVRQLRRNCAEARAASLEVATYSPLPILEARRSDRRWVHEVADAEHYADGSLSTLARRVALKP